jgi:hypothetical protein
MGDEPGVGTGALVENDTKLLYEDIRPLNGLSIPHTSGTDMGTDWRDNDPNLEPVVEIFQGARSSYEMAGAPYVADPSGDPKFAPRARHEAAGMVVNAWAKGYRLGVISSSDHYSTHISCAMVYTADGSRGILDAIRRHHTYGAMDNIILDVAMGKHFGDVFTLGARAAEGESTRYPSRVARVGNSRQQNCYTVQPKQQQVQFGSKTAISPPGSLLLRPAGTG